MFPRYVPSKEQQNKYKRQTNAKQRDGLLWKRTRLSWIEDRLNLYNQLSVSELSEYNRLH